MNNLIVLIARLPVISLLLSICSSSSSVLGTISPSSSCTSLSLDLSTDLLVIPNDVYGLYMYAIKSRSGSLTSRLFSISFFRLTLDDSPSSLQSSSNSISNVSISICVLRLCINKGELILTLPSQNPISHINAPLSSDLPSG